MHMPTMNDHINLLRLVQCQQPAQGAMVRVEVTTKRSPSRRLHQGSGWGYVEYRQYLFLFQVMSWPYLLKVTYI